MNRQASPISSQRRLNPLTVPLVVLACWLVAACGGSDEDATIQTTNSTTTTEVTTTTESIAESTTTSVDPTASETTDTALAGEPIDFGPREGDTVAVIGVAYDDTLNVRRGPGTNADIVDTLDPLSDDLVATGVARHEVPGFWIEVDTGEATGWVSLSFIAHLGVVDDRTSQVIAIIGERPVAETMIELGTQVAETFASEEPASDIVQVTAPSTGDLGEITFDVIGIGDDAVAGFRVHVFGQPDTAGETYGLASVEVTTLCSRGVSAELLCT